MLSFFIIITTLWGVLESTMDFVDKDTEIPIKKRQPSLSWRRNSEWS